MESNIKFLFFGLLLSCVYTQAWEQKMPLITHMQVRADWIRAKVVGHSFPLMKDSSIFVKVWNCTMLAQPFAYTHIWKSEGRWVDSYFTKATGCEPKVHMGPVDKLGRNLWYLRTLPIFAVVRDPAERFFMGFSENCDMAAMKNNDSSCATPEDILSKPLEKSNVFLQGRFLYSSLLPDYVGYVGTIDQDAPLFLNLIGALARHVPDKPHMKLPRERRHEDSEERIMQKELLLGDVLAVVEEDYCDLFLPIPPSVQVLDMIHCQTFTHKFKIGKVDFRDERQLNQINMIMDISYTLAATIRRYKIGRDGSVITIPMI